MPLSNFWPIYAAETTDTCSGCVATNYYDGLPNSKAIVSQALHTISAACICRNYTNANYGTGIYSDWYLPSLGELNECYSALAIINTILSGISGTNIFHQGNPSVPNFAYWSSTEMLANAAWEYCFSNAVSGTMNKNQLFYVRAVRKY